MSSIELIAAAITAVSIWLATRENVWYYPSGIASVLLYGWTFLQAKLYGESALQIVWLALLVYGWYEWLYGGPRRTKLPVVRTPRRGWIIVVAAGVVLTVSITAIQTKYTDNPAPLIDSTITAWSIAAQWMTARKWLENWLFWIGANLLAIPLYLTRGLTATAVLYTILLILAIEGYRKWRTSLVSV